MNSGSSPRKFLLTVLQLPSKGFLRSQDHDILSILSSQMTIRHNTDHDLKHK